MVEVWLIVFQAVPKPGDHGDDDRDEDEDVEPEAPAPGPDDPPDPW